MFHGARWIVAPVVKARNLLVPVHCTSRSIYLFRPANDRNYWVKFRPPRVVNGARVHWPMKTVCRSTGTSELPAARRNAAEIVKSFWLDNGRTAEELKQRGDYARIGDVIERYQARAGERRVTVRSNISSLRLLLRTVRPGDPDAQSTELLTADLVGQFERARLYAADKDPVSIQRARQSTASYLRQARSILAPAKMEFYDGLRFPDLTGFRKRQTERPKRSRPRPIDMSALAAMDAAAPRLAETDPAVYVAHLLFAYAGLRNIEIYKARTWWLSGSEPDGQSAIHIIDRPEEDFYPKGCEGSVPLDREVIAEILKFQDEAWVANGEKLCTDGYLVPGRNGRDRHEAIYRRHSRWVSTWIKDRTKTSYELRRYAGSRLLDLGATIFDVRDFLRHRDVTTTQNWYAYRLANRAMPTIKFRQLVPSAA